MVELVGVVLRGRFKWVTSEQQLPGTFHNTSKYTELFSLCGAKLSGCFGFNPLQSNPLKPFSQIVMKTTAVNLSFLRVVRLLRIAKILRLFRILHFFQENNTQTRQ